MIAIVGNSKKVVDQLNRIGDVSHNKLYLIYNGLTQVSILKNLKFLGVH